MEATNKPLPDSFTPEQREMLFQEIVRLYNYADEMAEIIKKKNISNPEIQLELATPFITQVVNSANILSVFYTEVVHKNHPITPELQDTLEGAFRTIFYAFRDFLDGTEEKILSKKESV
jgi:hypothetical protein